MLFQCKMREVKCNLFAKKIKIVDLILELLELKVSNLKSKHEAFIKR